MPTPAPTTEQGSSNAAALTQVAPWNSFYGDENEHVSELVWPRSVQGYNVMRTDSQVHALEQAIKLPLRRYNWVIAPNGSKPEVYQKVAEDFGLPVKGEPASDRRRRRNRFSHDFHLYHALLGLTFGHSFFEQVGAIEEGLWRMRKLGPRLPHTISEIKVAKDGGLEAIKQAYGIDAPEISVNRLVAYVWEREGGNWSGRSMLRPLYKNWLIKDRLLRVDAINIQRAGAGQPVATGSPDMQAPQLEELGALAAKYKVGEAAGAALPYGSTLKLLGIEGSIPDAIGSIRYHDESMARAFLAMFIQLGQTQTGSRALGAEFIDFFALALEAVASWYCDTTNEHVIEDWVDWNFGEDEPAPTIEYVASDPELSITDLALLIEKGAITVDEELETVLREKHGLPEKPEEPEPMPTPPPPVPPETPPEETTPVEARRRRTVTAAEAPSPLNLPDRDLRREPYEQEVRAAVDFAQLDQVWQSSLDSLIDDWSAVTEAQAAELRAAIAATTDLTALAEVSAAPAGAELLREQMEKLVKDGATAARAEAVAQGRTVKVPNLDEAIAQAGARAEAVDALLAKSLSETAGRQAVNRSGGALAAEEVAEAVEKHLLGLSGPYLRDQLAGALTQALNSGRREVMKEVKPAMVYASELLDENTCDECTEIDGTEYDTVEAAEEDYPTGGYSECAGGPRCRGTLVAVYDEEDPSA